MSGRYLITIGSPDCPLIHDDAKLDRVESDIQDVARLLTAESQNYEHVCKNEIPLGATAAQIKCALSSWFADRQFNDDDGVVIYVAGHGDTYGRFQQHALFTSDSRPNRDETVLYTAELVRSIYNGRMRPPHVVLILDVCYAGQGSGEALKLAFSNSLILNGIKSFCIIATSSPYKTAGDGRFVSAWKRLMSDDAWFPRGGTQFLTSMDLADALNQPQYLGKETVWDYGGRGDQFQFLLNPNYTQIFDGRTIDDQAHWEPKARGTDGLASTDWFFCGRKNALDELASWLSAESSDGRVRFVTAAPGSGKSAVLSWLVLASQRRIPDTVVQRSVPPLVSLHVHGMQWSEVLVSLSQRLKSAAVTISELVRDLASRSTPVAIIIDSLDESADQDDLANILLRELALCPNVRLIVGGRRRGDKVPLQDISVVLDLDQAPYFSSSDVIEYLSIRLSATQNSGKTYDPATAARIADYIGTKAGHSFLYARLVVHSVMAMSSLIDTKQSGWETNLDIPNNLDEAFEADLSRFSKGNRRRFRDLLVPLAYARGRGLPQKVIWATIASKIAAQTYTNDDLRDLKREAGYYIVQDTENGETVYRLFHQALGDFLKRLTRDEDVERSIVDAITSLLAPASSGMDPWEHASEPYILTFFPAHAAAARMLDNFLKNPAFLMKVQPSNLAPYLAGLVDADSKHIARAYQKASHWWRKLGSSDHHCYLHLSLLQHGAIGMAEKIKSYPLENAFWRPLWTRWDASVTGRVVGTTPEKLTAFSITALSFTKDKKANLCVVCGYSNGSVLVWRVIDSELVSEFQAPDLLTQPSQITGMVTTECEGQQLIICAFKDGTVRSFDQSTKKVIGIWKRRENPETWTDISKMTPLKENSRCLLAVVDYHDLVLLELPLLKPSIVRKDAVEANIYALNSVTYKGKNMLLSTGDTVSGGTTKERYPLRLWNLKQLNCQLRTGRDSTIIEATKIIEVESTILTVSEEGSSLVFRECHNFEPLLRYESDYETPIGSFTDRTEHYLLTKAFSTLRLHKMNFADGNREQSSNQPGTLRLEKVSLNVDYTGSLCSDVTLLDSRPIFVSATDTKVKLWDLREIIESGWTDSSEEIPFRLTPLASVDVLKDTIIGSSEGGTIWAWNLQGILQWTKPLGCGCSKIIICDFPDEDRALIAGNEGYLYQIKLSDGSESRPPIKLGDKILNVKVTSFQGRKLAFVSVRSLYKKESIYFVRIWDLTNNVEINSLDPKEVELEALIRKRNPEMATDFAPDPALILSGYYKEKPLPGLCTIEHNEQLWIAFGGARCEFRIVDVPSLTEISEYAQIPSQTYLECMATLTVNGIPMVYGGDQDGHLFRVSAKLMIVEPIFIKGAHRNLILSLLTRETTHGKVVISGSTDGTVRFWDESLKFLAEIEIDRSVRSLCFLNASELLITTDRGMMCLVLNWEHIFKKGCR